MNFYEHTIIARQDTSPSQLKQIQEKYTNLVNKNDGDLAAQASKTASDYKSALSFYNKDSNTLDTQVVLVSSVENKGMDLVLDAYNQITETNKNSSEFQNRRKNQLSFWFQK